MTEEKREQTVEGKARKGAENEMFGGKRKQREKGGDVRIHPSISITSPSGP